MENKSVKCGKLNISNKSSFTLIAGPCQLESEKHALEVATELKIMTEKIGIGLIYKTSFDKANRTSLKGKRGAGLEKSLPVFDKIRKDVGIPVLTDVHNAEQCAVVSKHVDILQIPAFLCRQTDLLIAAAKTNKIINVKKGPFLSGESCQFIIEKIQRCGNNQILITERGNSFGYQNLVVDMRNIPIIKNYQVPVIIDATHSNQKPNQPIGQSGGTPDFIETIAHAGIAAGANGIFLETHPNPTKALSDGSNMLPLSKLEELLVQLIAIKKIVH
mgnify:CR=1 FL=1